MMRKVACSAAIDPFSSLWRCSYPRPIETPPRMLHTSCRYTNTTKVIGPGTSERHEGIDSKVLSFFEAPLAMLFLRLEACRGPV